MPLYEYECDACGHRFEVIQKFSDPPVGTCPVCGGAVHKLQSAPAFQFKGTGWYVTDYANKPGGASDGKGAKDGKKDDKAAGASAAADSGPSGEKSSSGSGEGGSTSAAASSTPAAPAKPDSK